VPNLVNRQGVEALEAFVAGESLSQHVHCEMMHCHEEVTHTSSHALGNALYKYFSLKQRFCRTLLLNFCLLEQEFEMLGHYK